MWVESFIQHVEDLAKDKSNVVLLKFYACGQEQTIALQPDMVERTEEGDVIILADFN